MAEQIHDLAAAAAVRAEIDAINVEIDAGEQRLLELRGQMTPIKTALVAAYERRRTACERYAEVAPPPEPEYVPEVVITMKPRSEWPVTARRAMPAKRK